MVQKFHHKLKLQVNIIFLTLFSFKCCRSLNFATLCLGPCRPSLNAPLSALSKYTSYFENDVILVLLRMVTFFIILSSAFELLGFRLNVVDCQAYGVSSDVITD